MISHTTREFRRLFRALPRRLQRDARDAYRLFREDPGHPSLRFKQIAGRTDLYSVRVGLRYRAVGLRRGDTIVWFWIGNHAEYERLLSGR